MADSRRPGPQLPLISEEAEPADPSSGPCAAPGWFDAIVVLAAGLIGSISLAALILAILGTYSLLPALALGLVLGVPAIVVAVRTAGAGPDSVGAAAVVCVLLVVAFVGFWSARPSQHVLMDRDPGSYVLTAVHMSGTGKLVVETAGTPFVEFDAPEQAVSVDPRDRTNKLFQFNHLLPAVLAVANDVGGHRLMFRMSGLLLGVGLLGLYSVSVRSTRRPWLSLLPVLLLGVSAPLMYVGRDAFSESLTLALLWAALALGLRLCAEPRPSGLAAAVAGFLLGATTAVRIDSLLYLAAIAPLVAAWVVADPNNRRRRLTVTGWFIAGALPPMAVGFVDLNWLTGHYQMSLGSRITAMRLGLAAVLTVVVLGGLMWARWAGLRSAAADVAERLAVGAGLAVSGLFMALWFLRPVLQTATGTPAGRIPGLQEAEGLAVDVERTFSEMSMEWLSWYVGPVALALAVVAAGLVTARMLRGRSTPAGPVLVCLLLTVGLLYLWSPQITPDQLWASRRFVPAVLPAVAALATVGTAAVVDLAALTDTRRRVLTAAIGFVMLIPAAASTAPIVRHRAQHGFLGAVESVCTEVGASGAILLPQGYNWASVAQTFRSWCGVPVAVAPADFGPADFEEVAAEWGPHGRELFIVTQDPVTMAKLDSALGGPAIPVDAVENPLLAQDSVSRLPQGYESEELSFLVRRIEPVPRAETGSDSTGP